MSLSVSKFTARGGTVYRSRAWQTQARSVYEVSICAHSGSNVDTGGVAPCRRRRFKTGPAPQNHCRRGIENLRSHYRLDCAWVQGALKISDTKIGRSVYSLQLCICSHQASGQRLRQKCRRSPGARESKMFSCQRSRPLERGQMADGRELWARAADHGEFLEISLRLPKEELVLEMFQWADFRQVV